MHTLQNSLNRNWLEPETIFISCFGFQPAPAFGFSRYTGYTGYTGYTFVHNGRSTYVSRQFQHICWRQPAFLDPFRTYVRVCIGIHMDTMAVKHTFPGDYSTFRVRCILFKTAWMKLTRTRDNFYFMLWIPTCSCLWIFQVYRVYRVYIRA